MRISNFVVVNDIIQNFAMSGISLDNGSSGPAATSATIQGNVISNNGNSSPSQPSFGVILYNNAFAAITNNTIIVPAFATGIQAQSFLSGTAAMTWSGNTVTVGQDGTGIDVNHLSSANSAININTNTVNAAAGVTAGDANGLTWGIVVDSVTGSASATLTGDTVGNLGGGGTFDRGMDFWNDSTTNSVTVVGGSVGHSGVGIEVDNVDPFNGSSTGNSTVNVNNVAISGATTAGVIIDAQPLTSNTFGVSPNTVNGNVSLNISAGSILSSAIGVLVETASAGAHTAQVQLSNGVSITNGTTGIELNGANTGLSVTGRHSSCQPLRPNRRLHHSGQRGPVWARQSECPGRVRVQLCRLYRRQQPSHG